MRNVTADTWIQVVPVIGDGYYNKGDVVGAKAVRMGVRRPKPENRIPGSVLMRVSLEIPVGVFDPIVETTIRIDDAQVDVTVEQGELV